MGDAKAAQMVKPHRLAAFGNAAGFGKGQVLAPVLEAKPPLHGKIPDVELIDDGIGDGASVMGIDVLVPALRIGGGQIDDHGAAAVDAYSPGIGITGFPLRSVCRNHEGVVDAPQILPAMGDPSALYSLQEDLSERQRIWRVFLRE